MILYESVGAEELRLIALSGYREFPSRSESFPIFYPTLTLERARMIARDYCTIDDVTGYVGYVVRFAIEDAFVSRYRVRVREDHEKIWVQAEELEEWNQHLVGPIEVIEAFAGPQFSGTLVQPIERATSEVALARSFDSPAPADELVEETCARLKAEMAQRKKARPLCYVVLLPRMIEVARGMGYALCVHGSLVRDMDLVAVPWTDSAGSAVDLVAALVEACGGVFVNGGEKPTLRPHGRLTWTIHVGAEMYVDLSVMPCEDDRHRP